MAGRVNPKPRTSQIHPRRAGGTARPARATGPVPAQLRAVLLRRDGWTCQRCGEHRRVADGDYSLQHRLPRGRGGLNEAENLVVLCGSATTGCHGEVESHRDDAMEDGFLLPDGADPATSPVLRWATDPAEPPVWALPTADGWTTCDPPEVSR